MIKAVIFDMGGTIETFSYTRELRLGAVPGFRARLAQAGLQINLDDSQLLDVITSGLKRYHEIRKQTLQELPTDQIWREYIFMDYLEDPHLLDEASEALMSYFENHFYRRAMRAEVPSVLEAIRQMGLKIGLISNISSKSLVPTQLREYGIIQYFDPIVLSSEYGRRKPDPAIFHHAARLANLPTSQCLYVGDRVARDIVGARRAGYGKAIQIEHDFEHGEDDRGAIPDKGIQRMTELVDYLRAEVETSAVEPLTAGADPIRAYLFDAGDILYRRPGRGARLNAFLKDLSIDTRDDHAAEKQALSNQAFQGQITQEAYRQAILGLYGVTDPDLVARGKQVIEDEDNDVLFFDGVAETLQALKQRGYLLGIITDTANPVHVKLSWFERGNFGHVWDSIISSQEIGVRKPHPEIYWVALRQLGLNAEQAVFVGHKASELEGARQVGMKTVAFNYDKNAQADCYIENFCELLDLTKARSSKGV